MSVENAKAFLDRWVTENVHDTAYPQDNIGVMQLAMRCLETARDQGITKAELEEAAGKDLVKCMMDAQVATADAKIGDLIEKED